MDRLICGDVGFGKTEVAIRAAFKAVMGGRQVAVLVPTTVLAQQHYNTFRERMAEFPISVELLSRFRSKNRRTPPSTGWPPARSISSSARTSSSKRTFGSRNSDW